MHLVDGPFKTLMGGWKFTPLSADACRIEFHLDFEFTNKLIELAFGRIFKELASNMVQAFTTRAKEVYSVAKIAVEVAYALPEKQYLQRLRWKRARRLSRRFVPQACWSCAAISIWRKQSRYLQPSGKAA
jgi:hypothetical protein